MMTKTKKSLKTDPLVALLIVVVPVIANLKTKIREAWYSIFFFKQSYELRWELDEIRYLLVLPHGQLNKENKKKFQ